jgi:tetratricopeptide (TPR) repeat protein
MEALRDFKRALALDPSDPEALLWLGYVYAVSGRVPLARALMERLQQVDPLTSINLTMYGIVAMMDGCYDEALGYSQRAVDIDPSNPTPRMMHAMALAANERTDEAVALLDAVTNDTPSMAWAQLAVAMSHALQDDREGVLRVMTPELRTAAWSDDIFSWWSADCFALVGENEAALGCVERAVEFGFINYPFLSQHEPFLTGIRGEPRFESLMERVRVAWNAFEG